MKSKTMLWLLVGIILTTAAILWGPLVSNVEQTKYKVVESFGGIEIRDYSGMIVAEVQVPGDRKDAANKGFRLLAGYIFGENESKNKIAMTAPVIQESVGNEWKVRFIMPSYYSMERLPAPNNTAVKLTTMQGGRFVVIRFSGLANERNLKEHQQKLVDFVRTKKLKPISEPIYAFFNPPWTLPLLRRNEIMIEIKR
ncbi:MULTISPECIES: SOUL family heme-binding protein [unclassified Legionella]|uniref:SOUL family heme-binding protein n=2 Tax=Legionella TaxID=445 RepID=UPI001E3404D2|nr:heme-binding protein [Legionella sp. 31fI33]MCC5013553.1 heme-binding protein [Legionella sp. 31fI33]